MIRNRKLKQAYRKEWMKGRRKRIPSTKRWCLMCEKMTTFKYSRSVFHSRCKKCAGSLSFRENPNDKTSVEKAKGLSKIRKKNT